MFLKPPISQSSGFSLLELLVVITLLGIFIGVGLWSFGEITDTQTVAKSKANIISELEKSRREAFYGKKPSDPACDTLDGYQVQLISPANVIANPSQLIVEMICDGTEVYPRKTIPLDKGVLLNPNVNSVIFYAIVQQTNLASPLTITLSKGGKSDTITIATNGQIQ